MFLPMNQTNKTSLGRLLTRLELPLHRARVKQIWFRLLHIECDSEDYQFYLLHMLLYLPFFLASIPFFFCSRKKAHWDDNDFCNDERDGKKGLGILGRA